MNINRLRRSIGAILIEFAFATPVFLVLIYYIHDLPRLKLIQRKVQFMSYEMSASLQNLAKAKADTDAPLITAIDVSNVIALSGLSYFAGNTLFGCSDSSYVTKTGYVMHTILHYIKGTEANKGQQKWLKTFANSFTINNRPATNSSKDTTIISWSTAETVASSIHPQLSLDGSEDKIILELELFYDWAGRWNWSFTDGTSTKLVSPNKVFGFLFLSPTGFGQNKCAFFPAVTIFTPLKGSFSESAAPK